MNNIKYFVHFSANTLTPFITNNNNYIYVSFWQGFIYFFFKLIPKSAQREIVIYEFVKFAYSLYIFNIFKNSTTTRMFILLNASIRLYEFYR